VIFGIDSIAAMKSGTTLMKILIIISLKYISNAYRYSFPSSYSRIFIWI